jgi:hypothetical protein
LAALFQFMGSRFEKAPQLALKRLQLGGLEVLFLGLEVGDFRQ